MDLQEWKKALAAALATSRVLVAHPGNTINTIKCIEVALAGFEHWNDDMPAAASKAANTILCELQQQGCYCPQCLQLLRLCEHLADIAQVSYFESCDC